MTGRRKRSNRRRGQGSDAFPMAIGIALIVAVAAVVAGVLYMKPSPIERDARGCRSDGPSSVTAILVDRTDSFDPITAADIKSELFNTISEVPSDGLVEVYELGPVTSSTLSARISVCNPGSPEEADPLFSSPRLVQKHWDERFISPIDTLLSELLEISEASSSPVMEGIASVKVTAFSGSRKSAATKRLIIVSDMLQHSDKFSLYRSSPDFPEFDSSDRARELDVDLSQVDVRLLLIQRRFKKGLNTGEYVQFWIDWLNKQRASRTTILRLTGSNG